MAPRAWIVVDLGFGDSGKGAVTDFLVRRTGARWVVRYNGGAQAGHNVVTGDRRHHTFSQLGAGMFVPGVETYLAPRVILHPGALVFEARHLGSVGVSDALRRLHVAHQCLVTTPFHQAAGRLRELGRGAAVHGTCGVGVGETVLDALACPDDALRAGHLRGGDSALARRLERIRVRVLAALERVAAGGRQAAPEWDLLRDRSVAGRWIELIAPALEAIHLHDDGEVGLDMLGSQDLVLEGAQGVLLDQWAGFHPHTTWSTCTTRWAERWLAARPLPHQPLRLGVLRTYATRHGPGPFPSEAPRLAALLPEQHNGSGGWQGAFRVGWPDPLLTGYAIRANRGVDALAVTHVDRLAAVPRWLHVSGHPGVDLLTVPQGRDLARQEALGAALARARCQLAPVPASGEEDHVAWLERSLGVPVALTTHGPTAAEARWANRGR